MNFDIIVPIYNAYSQVKNCLESLSKYQDTSNITLIDDASTNANIKPLLKKFAQLNNWQVIYHQENQGFVQTANQGLRLSDKHTILLNSDTIVTQPWLQAFAQAINVNPKLGTATPWSNNAEICSFPNFLINNKPPKNPNKIAQSIYNKHQPQYPIIPTAVGFCMLITSTAKKLVGYFDAGHFGHGYGEENDYSLRVTSAGLTNILCDNAYIVHIGNQSFSDLAMQPNAETMQRLLHKHPNYLTIIQQYINIDPLRSIRQTVISKIQD